VNELLKSGTILMNTYKILGVIDQGGMGAIYKAESRLLAGEEYAVKEMLDNYSSAKEKQEGLDLFQQESDILKKLRHPNLPRVHAFFEENNRYYLAMDYIKGRTLEDIVESTTDYIPESVVLRWSTDLCNILEYLHHQKPPIIFRDLNPRNIMLEESTGDIKLIDFGIARFFKAGQSSDTLSLGSPGYCPIEQYGRGQTDIRSDVYTLGATLYHLLTKKVPIAAIERIKPTPVALKPPGKINRRISAHGEKAILQALEINPDNRFQTVGEMRQALFTKGKTKKVEQETQKTNTPKTADAGKNTAQKTEKTTGSTTRSRTARQTEAIKPRSNRSVWFVVLVLTSILAAQWIEGWQDRDSGRNATPGGATVLAIPGTANDRVNFLYGDRTDWWSFAIAFPGTLTITAILPNRKDNLRLTLYDRRGQSILKEGKEKNTRVEAVFIAEKPMTVLAQVLAPRLWDATTYTLHAEFAGPEGRLLASLVDLNAINATVANAQANLSAGALPLRTVRNYVHPDSAPLLPLNTVINSQLVIAKGEGLTWWRADVPETGTLTLSIRDENNRKRPGLQMYNADKELLPILSKRRGEQVAAVQGDRSYFIKVHVSNYRDLMTYSLTTQFEGDPDVWSGRDRSPDGAGTLPYQGTVRDTVAYTTGDLTDWWKLTFPTGGRISLALQTDRTAGLRMHLFDGDDLKDIQDGRPGNAVQSLSSDKNLEIEADEGTDYFVSVVADTNDHITGYTLQTAFFLGGDANSGPDALPAGAKALPINGSSRGAVDYSRGDRTDWWRVTPSGSGILTITLVEREPAASILMERYNQEGTVRLDGAKPSETGRLELSINMDSQDTYLIKVVAEREEDASAYQIMSWYTISPDGSSGRDATPRGSTELQPGRSSRSSVNYDEGDRTDWWKIEIDTPGTLTVELAGEAFLANLDLAIYRTPETKTPLADARSKSSDEQLSLEVQQAGWYYIEVIANAAGDNSRYTINASFEEQ